MARGDKTCVMCNTPYKYCENCPSKYNPTETWRNIFCCENCRDLYSVYDLWKGGVITDKNAAKSISKLDTSYVDKINPPMRDALLLWKSMGATKKTVSKDTTEASPKKRGRKKNNEVN